MSETIKMTVEMDVTVPQALALQAMFEQWTYMGNIGMSRFVAFYADGDGNFRPNCKLSFSEEIPVFTKEIDTLAQVDMEGSVEYAYDFDRVARLLED